MCRKYKQTVSYRSALRFAFFLAFAVSAICGACAAEYDVAAYVWPAYQPEPRWKELGVFGEGIGEWQNVKEAVPKWKGHNQPLVPLWGYENEADPKVVAKKIDAAVAHGVNVFIYDWYWYERRPFLEDALDKGFLGAPNNEKMKFFIMWANHHVTKLWDNRVADKDGKNPIWRGWVDADEFRKISKRWIEMYFSRPNYYRIGGKPVLMIYEVTTFVQGLGGAEKAAAAIALFKKDCEAAGLGGVHLMACDYGLRPNLVKALGIDSATIYNFVHWSSPKGNPDFDDWSAKGAQRFDKAKSSLGVKAYFAHASVGWDTNPRYPAGCATATALNSSPVKFKRSLERAKEWCDRNTPEGCPKLISVNSWNEWTEGSYLEPDTTFQYGYLEAIKDVFVNPRAKKSACSKGNLLANGTFDSAKIVEHGGAYEYVKGADGKISPWVCASGHAGLAAEDSPWVARGVDVGRNALFIQTCEHHNKWGASGDTSVWQAFDVKESGDYRLRLSYVGRKGGMYGAPLYVRLRSGEGNGGDVIWESTIMPASSKTVTRYEALISVKKPGRYTLEFFQQKAAKAGPAGDKSIVLDNVEFTPDELFDKAR